MNPHDITDPNDPFFSDPAYPEKERREIKEQLLARIKEAVERPARLARERERVRKAFVPFLVKIKAAKSDEEIIDVLEELYWATRGKENGI